MGFESSRFEILLPDLCSSFGSGHTGQARYSRLSLLLLTTLQKGLCRCCFFFFLSFTAIDVLYSYCRRLSRRGCRCN